MIDDVFHWRCLCGQDQNRITDILCLKCGKQRWKQLGFSSLDAFNVLTWYLSYYLVEKIDIPHVKSSE